MVPVVLFAILKFKDELEQMSSSWGWTCFSDLHLRFRPSERVFPFFALQSFCIVSFFKFFVYLCLIFAILSSPLLEEKSCLNSLLKRLFSVHIKFFLFQYFLQFLNFSVIQVRSCAFYKILFYVLFVCLSFLTLFSTSAFNKKPL